MSTEPSETPPHEILPSQAIHPEESLVKISLRQLRAHLSQCIQRVQNGEKMIVTANNQPVAKIIPLHTDEEISSLREASFEKADSSFANADATKLPTLDYLMGELEDLLVNLGTQELPLPESMARDATADLDSLEELKTDA